MTPVPGPRLLAPVSMQLEPAPLIPKQLGSVPAPISDKHASFTNLDGKVTVTPHSKCKVIVNGVPITAKTKLQHLDRVIFGSNSAYLYVGLPSERGGEDWSRFDYDFFQLERAAAEGAALPACLPPGVRRRLNGPQTLGQRRPASSEVLNQSAGAWNGGHGHADPSILAVFQDYVGLMPLVAEANQMSEELKKGLRMELKVKNLASSDSRGYDLQKEVMVKVTNQRTHESSLLPGEFFSRESSDSVVSTRSFPGLQDASSAGVIIGRNHRSEWAERQVTSSTGGLPLCFQVWVWSKAKFINRKFLMEELYQRFLDGEDSHVAREDDPFWDPVEAVHLGSAHVWLQPLAHLMELEEQAALLDCDGLEEALLHVRVRPCSPAGRACGEEDVVMDPVELLGKRMDFQIHIVRCLGAQWLKEDAERGIQMGYRIYDLPHALYTKPVWKTVNPQIEESVQFTALNVSQEFLNYLQTNALIVDLWGLQEGCAELSCSRQDLMVTGEGHIMVDTKDTAAVMTAGQTPSDQTPELSLKLLQLQREAELLRGANRALREENTSLRESLERAGPAREPSTALTVARDAALWLEGDQERDWQAGCDRAFAAALKAFYQRVNVATGQLLRLRRQEPPEDDQMLRPFVHRQSRMLWDSGELLESSLRTLKTDVALIARKRRERPLQLQSER
ncbi:kinesin-like protein KIF28P [Phyllostomus discolor]|uniref:Kinesin-like protein KIF28P n=1 Tax=Phyllostomus discolor TaxID=89673 RepID=A0A7E6CYI2_9CHIR|nr:kinesin-like protein KIF28P [Phyllostomus discolor]